ncbi:MAG: 3',5'-cyclic-nucleotide phosphodiesterase [Rhodospirillales bacterium]|nr:3',5'-cyclic-nucleotide phosphodiesterase [Rhodospirillales bacterium]
MRFQILGSAGCIGSDQKTTSFLIDNDMLIDAGTGLGVLPQEALNGINHVFLSHAHMDHVALLPMLLDATLSKRQTPVTVYGIEPTLTALSEHVFNWMIAPDFRRIPTPENPVVRFSVIKPGEAAVVDGRRITAIPVEHSIPAVAYHLDSGDGSLVVATDMTVSDGLWPAVNAIDNLSYLLIETAFQDARRELCEISGHLCPSMLAEELQRLDRPTQVYITHIKPTARENIEREIAELDTGFNIRFLADGDVLTF